ncbi:MAG TPA: hypothetical protein VGB94_10080 [Acidobacteriaceae bacterium]
MITAISMILPFSPNDTALSYRHLVLSYVLVFAIQFGYAGYIALQRARIKSNSK